MKLILYCYLLKLAEYNTKHTKSNREKWLVGGGGDMKIVLDQSFQPGKSDFEILAFYLDSKPISRTDRKCILTSEISRLHLILFLTQ